MSKDYFNKKLRRKKTKCPNCHFTLESYINFCPMCGQENHDKKASLSLLFNDFVQDYFTFDNKFFRSIVPLIIKPGFLTKEYLEGRRKKYFLPIRFYLFVSFICLLIISFASKKIEIKDEVIKDQPLIKIDTNYFKDTNFDYVELAFIYESSANDTIYKIINTNSPNDTVVYSSEYYTSGNYGTSAMALALEIDKKVTFINSKEGKFLFLQKLKEYLPLFLLTIIPLLALLMKLFYRKKQRENLYINHFVFSLHLQSFNFILFLLISICNIWFKNQTINLILLLTSILYVVIASKNVYHFSFAGAFFRSIGLYLLALILSLILFSILVITLAISM